MLMISIISNKNNLNLKIHKISRIFNEKSDKNIYWFCIYCRKIISKKSSNCKNILIINLKEIDELIWIVLKSIYNIMNIDFSKTRINV